MRLKFATLAMTAPAAALGLAMVAGPLLAEAATKATPATALYADPSKPDLSGLWVSVGSFNWSPDKKLPKFTPKYAAIYAKRAAALAAGDSIEDPTADCLPPGMPHMLIVPYPFELMQTPGRVTFLYEYQNPPRRVFTDGRGHPPDIDPTFNGHSIGHWEGDTLVIETVAMRPEPVVDQYGIPRSDKLKVTERIRRTDPETLESVITLVDPEAYTEPFTVTRSYKLKPTWTIGEYVCEENNRNKIDPKGVTGFGVPAPKN